MGWHWFSFQWPTAEVWWVSDEEMILSASSYPHISMKIWRPTSQTAVFCSETEAVSFSGDEQEVLTHPTVGNHCVYLTKWMLASLARPHELFDILTVISMNYLHSLCHWQPRCAACALLWSAWPSACTRGDWSKCWVMKCESWGMNSIISVVLNLSSVQRLRCHCVQRACWHERCKLHSPCRKWDE